MICYLLFFLSDILNKLKDPHGVINEEYYLFIYDNTFEQKFKDVYFGTFDTTKMKLKFKDFLKDIQLEKQQKFEFILACDINVNQDKSWKRQLCVSLKK